MGNTNAQCIEASVVEASRSLRSHSKIILFCFRHNGQRSQQSPRSKELVPFVMKRKSPTISVLFLCHFGMPSMKNREKVVLLCVQSRSPFTKRRLSRQVPRAWGPGREANAVWHHGNQKFSFFFFTSQIGHCSGSVPEAEELSRRRLPPVFVLGGTRTAL